MTGIRLGVAYYPEQWPRERWATDAGLMAEAGLSLARVGEFAWAPLEPQEGRFELDWLADAIGVLAEAGLDVVLGTPTAAPPAWLVAQYPEILPETLDGTVKFGHRRHYCPNQPALIEATERIVSALAERFGPDERVVGWQIDNEFGGRCACDRCASSFQEWLERRYGSLERLNDAWGTAFWSQTYSEWTQIPLPDRPPRAPNPGLALDYRRFVSDSFVDYQALQARIVRKHVRPGQFVTHNLMGFGFPELDYHELARELDFVSWDNYPILDPRRSWTSPALNADAMRGLKGRTFWVMEQQVGPIGWEWLLTPPRGQNRVWVYQAIAHGAEAVLFFRWRTARFGTEQHWHGILDADGSAGRRFDEVRQLAQELRALGERVAGCKPRAEIAIVHDYDSRFAAQVQPTHNTLAYEETVHQHYVALRRLGLGVDVVSAHAGLERYRIVVAPNLRVMDERLAEALASYVREGGQLVLAPRAAIKDRTNATPERPLPAWLDELAGVRVSDYAVLDETMTVRFDGSDGRRGGGTFAGWVEELEPFDSDVLLRYLDGPFAGGAAVTVRREGAGATTYLGAVAGVESLCALYADVAADAGFAVQAPEDDVEVVRAVNEAGDEVVFVLNHVAEDRVVEVDGEHVPLDGYDVAVLTPDRSPVAADR
jgi:beta-galactosidase